MQRGKDSLGDHMCHGLLGDISLDVSPRVKPLCEEEDWARASLGLAFCQLSTGE